jgi:hypothetical protein
MVIGRNHPVLAIQEPVPPVRKRQWYRFPDPGRLHEKLDLSDPSGDLPQEMSTY